MIYDARFKPDFMSDGVIKSVTPSTFSTVRNGDLLGILNIIEYLRRKYSNNNLKFYIEDKALIGTDYNLKFLRYLTDNTDYLSEMPGRQLHTGIISVWRMKEDIGDLLSLNLRKDSEKKLCIFPLFDAPYSKARNWSNSLTQQIIDRFNTEEYKDYDKYLCCIKPLETSINTHGFKYSFDFMDNINHILSCEIYVGGDTGMSHFAGALCKPPIRYNYIPKGTRDLPFGYKTSNLIYI